MEALRLFKTGLAAVDARRATAAAVSVREHALVVNGAVVVPDYRGFNRFVVVGAGKAAGAMGVGLLDSLPAHLPVSEGLLITKQDHSGDFVRPLAQRNIRLVEAAHPVPDARGAEATAQLLDMLARTADARTLVFYLTSGGGSALTPLPVSGVTLDDVQQAVRWLLASGAPIAEVNAVRKHLCRAHGGRSALAAGASTVVTLGVSDVVGDSLATIAGGPTTADPTSVAEVRAIVERYAKTTPAPSVLAAGAVISETPKLLPANILPGVLVSGVRTALAAMERQAFALGLASCSVLTSRLTGEAKEVAKVLCAIALDSRLPRPLVLLAGGETTVSIAPAASFGLGGRNQELALAAAVELAGCGERVSLLSGGTDGTDGPTEYAGAVVNETTLLRDGGLVAEAVRAIEAHDSTRFFALRAPECLMKTGPTGTNVGDVIAIVVA